MIINGAYCVAMVVVEVVLIVGALIAHRHDCD